MRAQEEDSKAGKWRVWDEPARAMHWLLVVLIAACCWTGTGNQLDYHLYCGYAVL
jgi:cytochrome b